MNSQFTSLVQLTIFMQGKNGHWVEVVVGATVVSFICGICNYLYKYLNTNKLRSYPQ
jgi:hypothetical protein